MSGNEINYGVPNETLQDKVRFLHVFDCVKHDLAPDPVAYADGLIDRLPQSEFLAKLSSAVEELRA